MSHSVQNKFSQVRKRDGRLVPFDQSRITHAIFRAMEASKEGDLAHDPSRVSDKVIAELNQQYPATHIPQVEEIQDLVEETLILMEFAKTAKAYILYRHKRAQIRKKAKAVPEKVKQLATESKSFFSNALAEFIYYRTYSRWLEEENRRETWIETVERYMAFMKEKLGKDLSSVEYQEIHQAILQQQVMPSMRLLWSAGKAARVNNITAYNCSFIAPTQLQDLAEILYLLMSGVGVGFSVESQNVQQLPIIQRQTGEILPTYKVGDSKEGWGDALKAGLQAWYDGKDIRFDYSEVRPAGSRLHTMGGRSAGPEPLRALLEYGRGKILSAQGKRLRNIDVHDLICKIGAVVEMGGVRRAALISLSDADDEEMRQAKSGHFYINYPQRSMANNSAVYETKPKATDFLREWLALAQGGTGERGLFNRGGLETQLPERRWPGFEPYWSTSGTNPCVTGDTWVLTDQGPVQVKKLINQSFNPAVNGKAYSSEGFFKTGNKKIFEVETKKGYKLKATKNHQVRTVDYESRKIQKTSWKELCKLSKGDRIVLHNHSDYEWEGAGDFREGWLVGNLLGDGNIEKTGKANLDYWGNTKEAMANQALNLVHETVGARADLAGHTMETGVIRVQSVNLGKRAQELGLVNRQKLISEKIEETSSDFHIGFLQGWFDADGSVQGAQNKGVSIRLASSIYQNLQAAQRMLARLGIISTIYKNRRSAGKRMLPNGKGGFSEYECNPDNELIISGANITRFNFRIGFSDPEKQSKLNQKLSDYNRDLNRERFSDEIVSIRQVGHEDVYDCQVPGVNAFDGNGIMLHNCGEIILRNKQFCNLSEVAAHPEDTEETLLDKIRIASILGTYQSTLTDFPYLSPEWKKNCEEEHLLGVSITGQWDSPVVRDSQILNKLRDQAIATNRIYAKRLGVNESAAVTCIKPSGTVSQLVDAASGMHPRYAPYYLRRVRISAQDPLFIMLKEQKFPYHPEVGQDETTASTFVLEFPVCAPEGSITRTDLNGIEQLEYWKMVKENYTEHNPSVTISVAEEEWIEVANWLYNHWDILGGLSFLPRTEAVYQLAPFEEITAEEYQRRVAELPKADFSHIVIYEKEDTTRGAKELACGGSGCEIDPEEGSLISGAPNPYP
ncbi:Ribonucleoside-triphosphate reductase [Nitrosococcus halophilus Nc 4]|uniref:Ribonucleoside-triphosphate reductase n=1 Tax=Nitrosococcus halophilus (strain Nc4) TaxID=472759 RepID=D5C1W3_NITHN|nr:ATP cone domain-containing protein [Nitrosococcus halophilus]ADE14746.1 Ribonucleoside-triphosphate reductase [Nitrosococcus halophilus Nc 4]